jgi:hypothetical protein
VLLPYLEVQKVAFQSYFDNNYPVLSSTTTHSTATASAPTNTTTSRPGIINFAAYDQGSDEEGEAEELERYFDAPRAPAQTDPVQWWYAWKSEFPRLYRLARDIMSIPGRL